MTLAQQTEAVAQSGSGAVNPLSSTRPYPIASPDSLPTGRGNTGRGSVTDWRSPGFFFVVVAGAQLQELLRRDLSERLPHRSSPCS